MIKLKKQSRIVSYLEFKLNKELAYEDTFEKDHIIKIKYKKYVKQMTELKEEHFEVIDKNRQQEYEKMKKHEKVRFDKLRQIGCIACLKKGRYSEPVIHHIRKHTGLGLRPSHSETIPLCPQHHNMGNNSVHLNKKLFNSLYGTEDELLNETNIKINELERNMLFYDKGKDDG